MDAMRTRLAEVLAAYGADPRDAFDVVVPSLPGYGFSDAPRSQGMDPAAVAGIWLELMTDGLGYERFGAQGGDWGSAFGTLPHSLDLASIVERARPVAP